MKFLICDDSILARKQLSDTIKELREDAQIKEAKNGAECSEIYKDFAPDLVFIDIVMPVLDGIGAVKNIIAANPKATIIIVSTIGTKKEITAAIEAGASDFIQKPFSKDQVSEIIKFYSK